MAQPCLLPWLRQPWRNGLHQSCDRACLAGLLDTYLDAVAKDDARATPLAGNYRATENAVPISPGTGMWSSFGDPGAVQRRYYDPVTGQALFWCYQNGRSRRGCLHPYQDSQEQNRRYGMDYSRQGETMVSIAGFTAEPPRSESPVARDKRSTREQLIAAADSYFEGLERHESAGVVRVKGCPRVENGTRVTGMRKRPAETNAPTVEFDAGDCGDNLDRLVQIDRVVSCRYPVVDTEAGVVVGYPLFLRQPGVKRTDGTEWLRLLLSEVLTGDSGKISGIYAAMHYLPPEAPSATVGEIARACDDHCLMVAIASRHSCAM